MKGRKNENLLPEVVIWKKPISLNFQHSPFFWKSLGHYQCEFATTIFFASQTNFTDSSGNK